MALDINYHIKNWKDYKKVKAGIDRADNILKVEKHNIMLPEETTIFLLAHREALARACFWWEFDHKLIKDL